MDSQDNNCCSEVTPGQCDLPQAFAIKLTGCCCSCGEVEKSESCLSCGGSGTESQCRDLSQMVVVRQKSSGSLNYEYQFRNGDFLSNKIPLNAEKVSLCIKPRIKQGKQWYTVCVSLSFKQGSGKRAVSWYSPALRSCCNIGNLRRHHASRGCAWPRVIEVQSTPVPDFAPPRAEWMRGDPSELTDASYWPSMDVPVPQDSDETSVRYFNGELQIRVKDVGSNGFGLPWGHSRIYSNRLSNSFNFGNGTNWLVHEWPQLVRLKGSPEEILAFHPGFIAEFSGCTMVMLRGTRNAVWFDELKSSNQDTPSIWIARFGAKHRLEYNSQKKNFRVITANGQKWEFYPFTRPCYTPKNQSEEAHDRRLDGRLIRHVDPAGNVIKATYENGKLKKYERSGEGGSESFNYDYFTSGDFKGLLQFITWERGKPLERVEYTYYGKNDSSGKLGDLQTAKTAIQVDGEWKHRENSVHYYRYYTESNDTYCQGLLKYVVSPENFGRLAAQYGNPLSASDQTISGFADIALTYTTDSDSFQARRVKTIALLGGARQHSFEYQLKDGNLRGTLPPQITPTQSLFSVWHSKTIETKADGVRCSVQTNFIGQPVRQEITGTGSSENWIYSWKYDQAHAGLTDFYTPATVRDPKPDPDSALPTYNPSIGRHQQFEYLLTPGVHRSAYLSGVSEVSGNAGSATRLKSFEYQEVDQKYGIRALSREINHGIAINPNGTQDGIISYDMKFTHLEVDQDSRDGLACLRRKVTTLPEVSQAYFQNAEAYLPSGLRGIVVEEFDTYGNLTSFTDQRKTVTSFTIDIPKRTPISETITYQDGNRQSQLQFDYKSDDLGRVTEALGPWHLATVKVGEPEQKVRAATWYVYKTLQGELWTAQGYTTGAQSTCINPMAVSKYDLGNRLIDEIAVVRNQTGRPEENESFPQSSWCRWNHKEYSVQNTRLVTRTYHAIPAQGSGDAVVNYTETIVESDIKNRRRAVTVSQGTNYLVDFDPRGLPLRVKMGANASALMEVLEAEYDHGKPGGNGNLTTLRRFDGQQARLMQFQYDGRDRQKKIVESDGTQVEYEFNQHHSVHKMVRKSATRASKLAEQVQWVDTRGRVYVKQLFGFTSSGEPLEPIKEQYLFDEANQVVAIQDFGTFRTPRNDTYSFQRPISAFSYDGLGRKLISSIGAETVETSPPLGSLRKFNAYQKTETTYNGAGDPILVTVSKRAAQAGYKGIQSADSSPEGNSLVANNVWTSSIGRWFDPLGREVAESDFGNTDLRSFNHRQLAPSRFPTSIRDFDSQGDLNSVTDPLRNITRLGYDHAGRNIAVGENVSASLFANALGVDQGMLGAFGLSDDMALSQFSYNSENAISSSIFANTHTGTQTTTIKYASDGGFIGKNAPSASLPTQIVDPQGRSLEVTYNSLGEVWKRKDANGTEHEYTYDGAGRVISDAIVSDSPSINSQVMRIEYEYDDFGRLTRVDSYDQKTYGTRVNSVVRKYGSYNELLVEAQLHSPSDLAFTSDLSRFHGDARKLSSMTSLESIPGHVACYYHYPQSYENYFELDSTWYPGDSKHRKGRLVRRTFDNDNVVLGRATGITIGDKSVLEYEGPTVQCRYWGLDGKYGTSYLSQSTSIVQHSLSQKNGTPFSSLDYLGRETNRIWSNTSTAKTIEDIAVAWDNNDNIVANVRNSPFDNLDDLLGYDRRNRLISHRRGKVALVNGKPSFFGKEKLRQNWTKDQSGNWKNWRKELFDVANENSQSQFRSHTLGNEIAEFHVTSWYKPSYDGIGLMTRMPKPGGPTEGLGAEYDGWGRLTALVDSFGNRTEYEYDGLGRRILERLPSGITRHFYYDQNGRLISEFVQEPKKEKRLDREYIWSPDGTQIACRLRYKDSSTSDPEKLFALYDIQGRVVAIVDEQGSICERYSYDPQGIITFLQPNFQLRTVQRSEYEWEHFFPGMRRDLGSGLHSFGTVFYHAELGRMLPVGPISVLPESQLNAFASDFPFGEFRPSESSSDGVLKALGQMPAWAKATIGAVAVVATVACLVIFGLPALGLGFVVGGMAAGAVQGGMGATLNGGDWGDIVFSAGLGAAFGAVSPFGAIAGLAGSAIGFNIPYFLGHDADACARGWELGGLVGGVAGDFYGVLRSQKSAVAAFWHVGPDFLGASVGGVWGAMNGGGWNGGLHGANLGMMAGNLSATGFRGLWNVLRAKAPTSKPTRGVLKNANFAQKRPTSGKKAFSDEGRRIYSEAAGRPIVTIDDLASALRSGDVLPSQVPIDYVIVDGIPVIANTRSSDALRRADIPQSQWYGRNRTGQVAYTDPKTSKPITYDDLVRNQTLKNGYGPTGTPNP